MVPFEAFSIEEPQSSSAFCSGCDGGTQCERRSSMVLSCANAAVAQKARTAPSAVARMFMEVLPSGPALARRLLQLGRTLAAPASGDNCARRRRALENL